MYYIDKDKPVNKEGVQPIVKGESYYVKSIDSETKYRMVPGSIILDELKEDEANGNDYRYINAVDNHSFILTRYSRPNTGITAVIFSDKMVRSDYDIMQCENIYADKGVSVLGLTIGGFYMPIVFEKNKDSYGWTVDVHFCKQHESFVCVTSNVSAHFESIDATEDQCVLTLVFKYDTESGLKERKFGTIKFTKEGIFLGGTYHSLYNRDSMRMGMSLDAWKSY